MNKNYIISTSSTCDLTKEYLVEHNNPYVKFNVFLDEKKYKDDFFSQMTIDEFYNSLDKVNAKTSQPSPEEYIEVWEPYLKEGYSIIHLELSKGLSGGHNASLLAKDMIIEKYKDCEIFVVDTLCASAGLGLLLMIANEKKEEGLSVNELYKYLSEVSFNINSVVSCQDLTQLFKGGRLSKTKYHFARLLNIVPLIIVDKEGKLDAFKNIRGKNNAFKEVLKCVENNVENGLDYTGKFIISNSYCYDDAKELMDMLKDKFKKSDAGDKNIFNIGTLIGSHTGKGTIALFYVGKGRDYK